MAITIVATVSSENANSYVTLAEANSYFEGMPHFDSSWDALTDAQKNARLVQATRAIDSFDFLGEKYFDDQALEFPRNITDQSTDDGSIPQKVKDAQCEMIAWQYQHMDSSTGEVSRQVDKVGLGKGEIDIQFSQYKSAEYNLAGAMPERIRALLRHWLVAQGVVELNRA